MVFIGQYISVTCILGSQKILPRGAQKTREIFFRNGVRAGTTIACVNLCVFLSFDGKFAVQRSYNWIDAAFPER